MKINFPDEEEPKVEVSLKEPETVPIIPGDILLFSVGQMFDLKPIEIASNREKLNLLIDFAKTQTEDRSAEGIKWAIRSLQGKVGTPPLGQKWIDYLSEFCYISLEGMKLEKEKQRYLKNSLK
jgi:hypothetical protein